MLQVYVDDEKVVGRRVVTVLTLEVWFCKVRAKMMHGLEDCMEGVCPSLEFCRAL